MTGKERGHDDRIRLDMDHHPAGVDDAHRVGVRRTVNREYETVEWRHTPPERLEGLRCIVQYGDTIVDGTLEQIPASGPLHQLYVENVFQPAILCSPLVDGSWDNATPPDVASIRILRETHIRKERP